jgi:serine/threonine-protein kinase
VLIDRPQGILRLADFGLARMDDGAATRTGLTLASPAYAAPEQLAGASLGPASDLYALGVLLFELLAGRRPFESSSLGQLLRQVAQQPAPHLDRLCHGLPAGLADAVAACMHKQVERRPADALALARTLDRVAPPTQAPG